MKKFVCALLALMMLCGTALAAAVPSRTLEVKIDAVAENLPEGESFVLRSMEPEDLTGAEAEQYQALQSRVEAEIEKLKNAGSVDAYFGEGVDVRAALNADADAQVDVYEFCPLIAQGYEEEYGKVTLVIEFPTNYAGKDVAVAIGILDGENIEWTVVEAEALENGAVMLDLEPEQVLEIQEKGALLAVISK